MEVVYKDASSEVKIFMSDNEIKEMYERNIDMLYRICYQYFNGNISEIEDSIQNLFYKIISKNKKFDDLNYEKAWMIRSIKNECINALNKKSKKDVELDFDVAQNNKKDETLGLVLDLPEKYKLPIYLFYYENYSAVEIAKILGVKENTIYSQLDRGRELLRLELESE